MLITTFLLGGRGDHSSASPQHLGGYVDRGVRDAQEMIQSLQADKDKNLRTEKRTSSEYILP